MEVWVADVFPSVWHNSTRVSNRERKSGNDLTICVFFAFFFHRTESNVEIIQDADEHEDVAEPNQASGENDDQEEEEPTDAESDKDKGENEKERSRRVVHKRKRELVRDKELDVDKVIAFIQVKRKEKKQLGELEFFFANVYESTKRFPRYLQLGSSKK